VREGSGFLGKFLRVSTRRQTRPSLYANRIAHSEPHAVAIYGVLNPGALRVVQIKVAYFQVLQVKVLNSDALHVVALQPGVIQFSFSRPVVGTTLSAFRISPQRPPLAASAASCRSSFRKSLFPPRVITSRFGTSISVFATKTSRGDLLCV
jgi:hypothetical protein